MKGLRNSRFTAAILLCLLLVTLILPATASADTGPKPSVHVNFRGTNSDVCYGTLLSKEPSTGPDSVWDGTEEGIRLMDIPESDPAAAREIWQKFQDYKDPDGFYFLQLYWDCTNGRELAWTYYPPEEFKVLLYSPGSDTYVVSDVCKTYAFDSYYTMNVRKATVSEDASAAEAPIKKAYDYGKEIGLFALRIAMTLVIELAVALLFGFRKKNRLRFIAVVNLVTQILLNIGLNFIKFKNGYFMYLVAYIGLEIIVFIVEAAAYVLRFKKDGAGPVKTGRAALYAFVANLASFALGFFLARRFPRIF